MKVLTRLVVLPTLPLAVFGGNGSSLSLLGLCSGLKLTQPSIFTSTLSTEYALPVFSSLKNSLFFKTPNSHKKKETDARRLRGQFVWELL